MRKINVMYIFNDIAIGGAGRSLIDMLKGLSDKVNPIVVMREGSTIASYLSSIDARFYEIPFTTDFVKIGFVNDKGKDADFKKSYEAALQLVPIIKKEKVQLIHINSSVSYFAAIAALMTNIPYIWHIRELMNEQFNSEFLNEDLKSRLFAKAEALITISDYVRQRYLEKYELDSVKIYNGLDIGKYKLQINEEENDRNIFLAAAMITPEKGQWDAVRAVDILVGQGYKDVKLIMVGNGNTGYIWAIQKYIAKKNLEKNVFWIPFQDDLSQLRRKASYSITCSQNEAMGRVTVEAMLAGNIVIGARSGGTTEIIGEKKERGLLYELRNAEDLAEKMLEVMRYPDEKKKAVRENAQLFAEENFNSTAYCEALLQLYEKTVVSYKPDDQSEFLETLASRYSSIKDMKDLNMQDSVIQGQKNAATLRLVLKWLELRQAGHSLKEYFMERQIHSIAIYGMADLGRRLYDELSDGMVSVKYLLDRNPCGMERVLRFVSFDEEKIEADVIVVAAAFSEKQIINEIKGKGYKNVIGLSEILDSFDRTSIEI